MSKRILVMEDEKDNRQIIRDMLGSIDCEITEAEDGTDTRSRATIDPRHRHHLTCAGWGRTHSTRSGM